MGRDRGAAPRARRRPSRLLPRRDAGMSPTVQLHAGNRRARRSADGAGTAAPRRGARPGASAIAAGIQDAGRRASLPPDGEAAATPAAGCARPRSNPIAAAYFRAADEAAASADPTSRRPERALEPSTRAIVPESLDAVVDLLAEAGLMPERPRALLEGTAPQPSRLTQMRRADGVRPRHRRHRVLQRGVESWRSSPIRSWPGALFSQGPLRPRKRLMRPSASATWVSSTGQRAGRTLRRAMRHRPTRRDVA